MKSSAQILFLNSNTGIRAVQRRREFDAEADEAKNLRWLEIDKEYFELNQALDYPCLRGIHELHAMPVWWEHVATVIGATTSKVIVHFSGHGAENGALIMKGVEGLIQPITPDGIVKVLLPYARRIPLVVLNACYSQILAEKLIDGIGVVIGIERAVQDAAAITFSRNFYMRLVRHHQSIRDAYTGAESTISETYCDHKDLIKLRSRSDKELDKVLFPPKEQLRPVDTTAVRNRITDDRNRLEPQFYEHLNSHDLGRLNAFRAHLDALIAGYDLAVMAADDIVRGELAQFAAEVRSWQTKLTEKAVLLTDMPPEMLHILGLRA